MKKEGLSVDILLKLSSIVQFQGGGVGGRGWTKLVDSRFELSRSENMRVVPSQNKGDQVFLRVSMFVFIFPMTIGSIFQNRAS